MNARVWKVAPLLFGSGFCALVYQTAWQRELRLIFGASTAASAAVLAIFMGGLGLGSALLGARADRERQPLGLYANLELLISLSAALTPLLIGLARLLYVALGGTMSLGLVGGSAVRLVLSALVLAVPTLLMGGTLPAAARAAESAEDVRRRALAVLYGVNTLGAVAGATASTFFLFEVFGTRTTLWLACLLNVVVAMVARGVARGLPENEPSTAPADAGGGTTPATPAAPRHFVLGAAALVGFAFFLMELVWYRMLGPLLGGSTFTFGLILVVALAGIGLGGAAYAAWGQQRPATLRGFALTCLLEALFIAVPLALGDRVAVLTMVLRPLSSFGFGGLVLSWAAVAALVVLPAAFVSGVQFPLLLALLGRGGEDVGRQVGQAYAWNTVGSILGSLAGGFGLLPLLSAPGSWRLVGVILVALGLAALVLSLRHERPAPLGLVPALGSAALTAVLLTATGPTAAWRHNPIGAGRAQLKDASVNGLREWSSRTRRSLAWEADGVESSVGINAANGLAFFVNGKSDGNAVGDAGTQVMGGLIGALLHPQPRHALVIGLGTGSTAGWLGAVPEMERVDAVEIEPAILEMARRCADVNERVLDNPKVRIHIDDAREVLLASKDSYDIVFSEPSNPYRAGISSLFTREFYQAVRQRLAPGGLFLQWLQAYEVDARTVRSVYATLAAEFPAVETWQTQGGDLILVGSEAPLRHDVARLRARVGQEPYRRALAAAWNTDEVEGVLSHFVSGPRLTAAMADGQEALVNTDDLSYLEFAFARSVGRARTGFSVHQLWEAGFRMKAERPELVGGPVDWERVAQNQILIGGKVPPGGDSPASRQHRAFMTAYARETWGEALRLWREAGWQPRGPVELSMVAHVLAEAGDEAALPYIEQLRALRPAEAELALGMLRLRQGRLPDATGAFERGFAVLRQVPWSNRFIVAATLEATQVVAGKDAALGRRLFEALEQPFSTAVWQTVRIGRRLQLAEQLDFKGLCARALAPYEPHVPWAREFLTVRARCYGTTGHALAAQARADLESFMDAEPPSLWEEQPDVPGEPGPEHETAPVSGLGEP
ncbi:fused MFS/spermidine synthase [Archangium lipolyticum]|uniref:fused MFS/spermidine synthase n=1 Tax=Archangium lipolyticum TaxID=2970465 RepID=UPI00214A87F2|nr:fused MFS/spermidine synthase [Archangium lipolyticum]